MFYTLLTSVVDEQNSHQRKKIQHPADDHSRHRCTLNSTDTELKNPDLTSIQRVDEETSFGHSYKSITNTISKQSPKFKPKILEN